MEVNLTILKAISGTNLGVLKSYKPKDKRVDSFDKFSRYAVFSFSGYACMSNHQYGFLWSDFFYR